MSEKNWLSEEDQEKLRSAYKILKEFSEHEIPVIRFNCRKAKNELWQALFELDLIREEISFCR